MGAPARTLDFVAPVRAPIIQKVMDGRTSCGSAAYLTRETRAENRAPTTMPERMIMRIELVLRTRLMMITKKTAESPAARLRSWMPMPFQPQRMPRTAPNEAPVATPSVSGAASGLANSA